MIDPSPETRYSGRSARLGRGEKHEGARALKPEASRSGKKATRNPSCRRRPIPTASHELTELAGAAPISFPSTARSLARRSGAATFARIHEGNAVLSFSPSPPSFSSIAAKTRDRSSLSAAPTSVSSTRPWEAGERSSTTTRTVSSTSTW
jgi:hypothetical protein